jgi:DDRGK domain.
MDKIRKVVMLEDLANEFRLPTKDVIDRIERLLATKKLTGIIDDRGKFIYITNEEFEVRE